MNGYDPAIARLDHAVVYFPVRHHSPAAARLAEQAIDRLRPRAVLIEGPSDFNPQWAELLRDHTLPVAIYSYAAWTDGERHGAFYPFCVYSPEWHALRVAARLQIQTEFIDLPWAETARDPQRHGNHAYADGEERNANYMLTLAQRMGLDNFDDLWDSLFEIDPTQSLENYLERCHELMFYSRASAPVGGLDTRREAFMASRISAALATHGAPVLAITGGYHSWGLFERLHSANREPPPEALGEEIAIEERGIALTPYSYERLDALTGYDAGMPNPGFYHHAWTSRETSFPVLLGEVIKGVRDRKQQVSTADVIGVEALAKGLAELRGQAVPWRRELMDGVKGALIKDDLIRGRHPVLDAVAVVLRGSARGRLAEGSKLPPLVADIRNTIEAYAIVPERIPRNLDLNLTQGEGLRKARILHRLRGLEIHGYTLTKGGHLARRDDVTEVIERWTIQWSEEFDAACIERSIYGPTLEEASRAKLEETAAKEAGAGAAAKAASLLLEAALEGHAVLSATFSALLTAAIREDSEFASVTNALNTLVYLHRYDDVLGTRLQTGALLGEAYHRALWLVESMLTVGEPPAGIESGIALLRETLLRCGTELGFDQDAFIGVFSRLCGSALAPLLRGASAGVLWSMSFLDTGNIDLPAVSTPEALGDFLTGLFNLAREAAQRNPDLVARIDKLIMAFDDERFLEAVPSLRLAFSVFTPREKHHLVDSLFAGSKPLPKLAVTMAEAARAYAWESRLFREIELHGVLR